MTLVGTAGVGKTHLVLEVSNQWRNIEGKIFCDLTTATDLPLNKAIESSVDRFTPKDPQNRLQAVMNTVRHS